MYLIDTCAFLWSIGDDPSLSKKVRAIIEAGEDLYLSQTTLWEIAVKKTINKLELEEDTQELVDMCEEGNITILPIENRYFETIQKLPYIHGDPFDRLIMATALENNLTILTNDKEIKKYKEIKRLW